MTKIFRQATHRFQAFRRKLRCKIMLGFCARYVCHFIFRWQSKGQNKGKVYLRTGHESPDGVGGQRHAPAALTPGKRPGTQFIGGWVGPRAGLDRCEKFLLHRDSIPRPFSP